jgi:hypothetical protein
MTYPILLFVLTEEININIIIILKLFFHLGLSGFGTRQQHHHRSSDIISEPLDKVEPSDNVG